MPAPVLVKQSDISRALKAAGKENLQVARFEVDQLKGVIRVFTSHGEHASANEWDDVLPTSEGKR